MPPLADPIDRILYDCELNMLTPDAKSRVLTLSEEERPAQLKIEIEARNILDVYKPGGIYEEVGNEYLHPTTFHTGRFILLSLAHCVACYNYVENPLMALGFAVTLTSEIYSCQNPITPPKSKLDWANTISSVPFRCLYRSCLWLSPLPEDDRTAYKSLFGLGKGKQE
jgi:hypothetical protein